MDKPRGVQCAEAFKRARQRHTHKAAALLQALSPNYALAQQVKPDDERIRTERLEYPSPEGHGTMAGLFARPAELQLEPRAAQERGLGVAAREVGDLLVRRQRRRAERRVARDAGGGLEARPALPVPGLGAGGQGQQQQQGRDPHLDQAGRQLRLGNPS